MNAETFNALYEVGVPVFAYPGARPENDRNATRLVTRTRSRASVLGGHTDVVWVDGHSACIALSHVDVVTEDEHTAAVAELYVAPSPSCTRCYGADAERFVAQGGVTAPCPACGPSELEQLRAEVAELRAERHSTNESLTLAAEALQENRDVFARLLALLPSEPLPKAMLAEGVVLRAQWAVWEQVAAVLGVELPKHPDGITRLTVPVQVLRAEVEDPHDNPLHKDHLIPRDLPEVHVPFAAETEVEPSGCRYCGIPARVHAQQWKASVGWHKWMLPTQAQIKARMLARRAARTGGAQ
jgi:hypothetical protein